jgi:hypothetical protein
MFKYLTKYPLIASSLVMGIFLPVSLLTAPSEAVELSDGEKAFEKGPRLIRTAATSINNSSSTAKYQFTINVPEDAGEPLGAVRIKQKEDFDTVVFKENKTTAFEGDSLAGGSALALAAINAEDSEPGQATVVFDPPIEPGNTVTVSLKPKQNPFTGGVYLFGVTAYPAGENSQGMYLGSGRIAIYD